MSAAVAQLERILAALPDTGDRAFVLRHIPAWLRRQRRLAERDAAVRELATRYTTPSGRKLAEAMRRDMRRQSSADIGVSSASHFPEAHREALRRVIRLSRRAPSESTLLRALAGLGDSNSPEALTHASRDDDSRPVAMPIAAGHSS